MSISKIHFDLIAATIGGAWADFKSPTAHARFATDMAESLARFNPRFDRARFIAACTPRHYVGTRHANAFDRAAGMARPRPMAGPNGSRCGIHGTPTIAAGETLGRCVQCDAESA